MLFSDFGLGDFDITYVDTCVFVCLIFLDQSRKRENIEEKEDAAEYRKHQGECISHRNGSDHEKPSQAVEADREDDCGDRDMNEYDVEEKETEAFFFRIKLKRATSDSGNDQDQGEDDGNDRAVILLGGFDRNIFVIFYDGTVRQGRSTTLADNCGIYISGIAFCTSLHSQPPSKVTAFLRISLSSLLLYMNV